MGYLLLILSKLSNTGKIVAMKYCGMRAPGADNGVVINLWRSCLCFLIGALVWLISGVQVTQSTDGYWLILLSGISNAVMIFVWILATSYASLSLVEVFSVIGAVVLPLLFTPVLYPGETVSLWQWIGAALLIVAAVLFAGKKAQSKKGGVIKWVLLSLVLISMTGIGVSLKLYTAIESSSVDYFNFLTFGIAFVGFVIYFTINSLTKKRKSAISEVKESDIEKEETEQSKAKEEKKFPFKSVWYLIVIASVTLYIYQALMTYAGGLLPSAIFYPLGHAVGLIMVFLVDVLVFKEKLTVKNCIGLILAVVACVLTNLP